MYPGIYIWGCLPPTGVSKVSMMNNDEWVSVCEGNGGPPLTKCMLQQALIAIGPHYAWEQNPTQKLPRPCTPCLDVAQYGKKKKCFD